MEQPFSLQGKVAVVTGGASGIGRAIAELFAQSGAQVIVFDVGPAALDDAGAHFESQGLHCELRSVDVTDHAQVQQAFSSLRQSRLDILVNNAGVAHVGNLLRTTEADFDRVMNVNVRGAFFCAQAAVKIMVEQRAGVLLNMASIASLIGIEDRFAYSASKGAILSMTRSIAVDYMAVGVRCNCICPARVHTPFVDGFLKAHYPGREAEMFERLAAYQPIGRMGKPAEVAALALYLCSDAASFITGQAFPIDGGVLVK